jgi:hypothetical protein
MTTNHQVKWNPGSFIEVDDLFGGRKVVMAGQDGITFWDGPATKIASPLVVHRVLRPQPLGSLVAFVRGNGVTPFLKEVLRLVDRDCHDRGSDALFFMRVVWSLVRNRGVSGAPWAPQEEDISRAILDAEQQEKRALELQRRASEYLHSTSGIH